MGQSYSDGGGEWELRLRRGEFRGHLQPGVSGVSEMKPRAAEDRFRRGHGRRLREPGEAALEWNLREMEVVERGPEGDGDGRRMRGK